MTLQIDNDFKNLIPPLTSEEYNGLKESIQKEGCRDPLVVWNNTIIDGHNRYEICQHLNIPFTTIERHFPDKNSVVEWIIDNQISRRNLSGYQRTVMIRNMKSLIEKWEEAAKENKGTRTDLGANLHSSSGKTASKIAERAGVSTRQVYQVNYVEENAPEEVKKQALRGEISTHAAYQIAKGNVTIHSLTQAQSHEWYTPAIYIEAARRVLGTIDLDPASSVEANQTVKATTYYTQQNDGLVQEWKGAVWLNPPYKGLSASFIEKLLEQIKKGNVTEAIVLLNANSTETKWFSPLWNYILCFTDHRINFIGQSSTTSTHGSVFIYIGPQERKFYEEFKQFGYVVKQYV